MSEPDDTILDVNLTHARLTGHLERGEWHDAYEAAAKVMALSHYLCTFRKPRGENPMTP